MNVFMFTSVPIVPPWDQGDKNLAHELTRAMKCVNFDILTTRQDKIRIDGHIHAMPYFDTSMPTILQKAIVYLRLANLYSHSSKRKRPEIIHYVYRPNKFSTSMLRRISEMFSTPRLHTLPASADGTPLDKEMFLADHVVTLSRLGFQRLTRAGVSRVTCIPPGIRLDEWQFAGYESSEHKIKLGLEGKKVVLYPGHYGPGMGVETIIEALPKIVAKIPDLRIIFACRNRSRGDNQQERLVRKKLADLQLLDYVLFYQTVMDMLPLISASDLVLLPLESMKDKLDIPTTLVESMAAGKPLVISDLAPMNEILSTENGLPTGVGESIPPGDAGALASVVSRILLDDDLQRQIGKKGAELAAELFDIRMTAQKYYHLYHEMCG
jgi:glycosyltransferase involved in cell wall biosynthesis